MLYLITIFQQYIYSLSNTILLFPLYLFSAFLFAIYVTQVEDKLKLAKYFQWI